MSILGPNGAGKTTLIQQVTVELPIAPVMSESSGSMARGKGTYTQKVSAGTAGLQTGLHVAARFRGDHRALLDCVLPGADNFQVQRPFVAVIGLDCHSPG